MKVFITLYALTKGILEKDVTFFDDAPTMARGAGWNEFYHKPDWHLTRAEAEARAEQMRKAKLVSLEKQVKKLQALTFTANP